MNDRIARRQALRHQVMERSGGWCEVRYADATRCDRYGSELAHLHSIGGGGRKSADEPSNVIWACWQHARATDGQPCPTRSDLEAFYRRLGVEPGPGAAYAVAEKIRDRI